ncbi:cysteine dioxygenase [Engelhardtia mirabilis]|uniref:Cysteine dioxygenase type I n=1 Tax=Engelhardtia mirabilis TaxID=2528011 RepID=A0A518BL79_9BACT|nr:Cysteine dioxygenase type I [Planctomycetes bacterium Pla133]QDV02057.1 Cysteine dioxygenase type I [Planctomycetes bacterium Pla86]
MSSSSIDQLASTIGRELERPGGQAAIAGIIAEYARQADDWRAHAHFAEVGYTRHLLARTERFELLLLCWNAGLASDLHDHSGQSCWMTLLDGQIAEDRFRRDAAGSVQKVGTLDLDLAVPAFIDDGLGLHVIRNSPHHRSASLHVYARPVESCGIYCRDTGQVLEERSLRYDTVRGDGAPDVESAGEPGGGDPQS